MKKKELLVTLVLSACALGASCLMKSYKARKETLDSIKDENVIDNESENLEKTEVEKESNKKAENKNENVVKVNNSLITIKIKMFSH
jgi:hypothetical protein